MAVRIRMKRTGSKNKPCYRIVVADARFQRDGRFIENLGFYDPRHNDEKIDLERTDYWLGCGAQPSRTVADLIKRAKNPVKEQVEKPKKQSAKALAKAKLAAEAEKTKPAEEPKEVKNTEKPVTEEKPVVTEKAVEEKVVATEKVVEAEKPVEAKKAMETEKAEPAEKTIAVEKTESAKKTEKAEAVKKAVKADADKTEEVS